MPRYVARRAPAPQRPLAGRAPQRSRLRPCRKRAARSLPAGRRRPLPRRRGRTLATGLYAGAVGRRRVRRGSAGAPRAILQRRLIEKKWQYVFVATPEMMLALAVMDSGTFPAASARSSTAAVAGCWSTRTRCCRRSARRSSTIPADGMSARLLGPGIRARLRRAGRGILVQARWAHADVDMVLDAAARLRPSARWPAWACRAASTSRRRRCWCPRKARCGPPTSASRCRASSPVSTTATASSRATRHGAGPSAAAGPARARWASTSARASCRAKARTPSGWTARRGRRGR